MDFPAELHTASDEALAAYCQGALRDGTFSSRHRTHRIGQCDPDWLRFLGVLLERLGSRSWIYREGQHRRLWVLETTAPFLSMTFNAMALVGRSEGLDYVRGYFDADGGMPRDHRARLYFQFVQKDRRSLEAVAGLLEMAEMPVDGSTTLAVRWIPSTGGSSSGPRRTGDS